MNTIKHLLILLIIMFSGSNLKSINTHDETVLEQFFHQQIHCRLSKVFLLLRKINTTDLKILCASDVDITGALTMHSSIKHKRIAQCLNEIKRDKTITPCIQLINEFESDKYIHDQLFTQEFAYLILTIGKELLINCWIMPKRNAVLTYIIAQCEKLTPNDIIQILNTIDIITKELAYFIEKYELDSRTNWKEWIKKYWWAPPLVIGTIGLKILLQYKIYQSPTTALMPALNEKPDEELIILP